MTAAARQIPRTHGKVAIIDAADWEEAMASGRTWRAACYDGKWFAVSGHTLRLHRLLMDPPPRIPVAFVNGDTLDCRRANLRLRRDLERARRRERYIGVRRLASGRYSARMWHAGRRVYLGTFQTARDAALAVNVGYRVLRGHDARRDGAGPNIVRAAFTAEDLQALAQRLGADGTALPDQSDSASLPGRHDNLR